MTSTTTNNEAKATNFVNLSFFKIYVRSNQDNSPQINVFRNRRQQCRIMVSFIAVDSNNRQVVLTDYEMKSAVRLIKYTGGDDIAHGESGDSHREWYSSFTDRVPEWISSFTDQGFKWDPSFMATAKALQDDIDKVIAENLDIDNLPAFVAGKKTRISSVTSTSADHHWDKEFFENMVAECRRKAGSPEETLAPNNSNDPGVIPNEHPLIGRIPGDESEDRQAGAQTITFFVSTSAVSPLAIAARIRSESGQIFRTNYSTVSDPSGHGNGRGEFNSQVIVNTVAVPNYPTSAFGDFIVTSPHYVLRDHHRWGSTTTGLRVYEQYITLTADNRRIKLRDIVSPQMTRTSLWNDTGERGAEWSYSYTGQPGRSELYHTYDVIGFFTSGHNSNDTRYTSNTLIARVAGHSVHESKEGEVVIGQVMSNEHLQISDWNRSHYAKRSEIFVIRDEYGNDHRLRVYLADSGNYQFNFISIAKA